MPILSAPLFRSVTLRFLCAVLVAAAVCPAQGGPGALIWDVDFAAPDAAFPGTGAGNPGIFDGRRGLEISRGDSGDSRLRVIPVPVKALAGQWISLRADLSASGISRKPKDWNGVKVMLKLDTPRGPEWPQIPLPTGSWEWTTFSSRIRIPDDATAATLHLGLEDVSGTVWFANVRIQRASGHPQPPPAPADQPIFTGRADLALRGAMVHPEMTREDLRVLAEEWGGNLIRWQLLYLPPKGLEQDFAAYDRWLDGALNKLDQVLEWARPLGVRVVVDLHSPPGGPVGGGWVATASGVFWKSPAAQRHFVRTWETIARRYRDEREVIWGFDL